MVTPGVPTRFVPDPSGGWTVADGWVLHGKSFDQRDGTAGYDPDSDPSSIADGGGEDDSSTIAVPPGDNLSDTGDVGASASNSTNVGAIGSAVASVAANATPTPTATASATASATGIVAGHNVGATTSSTSSSPSYSPTDLPTGWEPAPSRTSYYEVPLIITMALLLAVFIVGTIAACVWRNQKKKKQLARMRAAKVAEEGGGDMDEDMWPDLERLRRAAEKEMEKRRRKEEREARPGMRAWLGAESKWRARLMLRKRGGRRRRAGGDKTEGREKDTASAASTSIDSSQQSGTFVRSSAPSPSPHISSEDASAPPAITSSPNATTSHLSHASTRFLPSASSSRAPSPSPSTSAARPPSYLAMSDEHDSPIASTSAAPIRQMYPDLPPSPPTPPPGLRTMVIPSRAHIATDDKRILARMGRASFPRSMDDAEAVPDVPEWMDEEPPFPVAHSSHPHHRVPHPDEREEDYIPLPPRSIAPEDEMFSFSGSNLPPPPPAFQHAVGLDPTVPFDPGLYGSPRPGEPVASAPYEEWDEYGDASAPPLEEEYDVSRDTLEQARYGDEQTQAEVRQ
ncbi:hypothetical protein CALVIDRAFT_527440 [Calocera viscosa TUFC12733]|uniref:Uncharacterized protein n=1 Tax=Calocera viscosa (strain TUFC12733) TaxID=1330018 RepID=A0A167M5A1_CALVF|nr:hypothetical protein CALVIDRAFT_527440 [Calocera viscosa TUFC12733]